MAVTAADSQVAHRLAMSAMIRLLLTVVAFKPDTEQVRDLFEIIQRSSDAFSEPGVRAEFDRILSEYRVLWDEMARLAAK